MPSVEVICIGQPEPSDFSALPLTVKAETHLKSHRSPSPLFQVDFNRLTGCIYHLGSPRLREPNATGAFTAGDLLTKWWEIIHFKPEFEPHIKTILRELLIASPEGRLMFTSDYQFGPDVYRYRRPVSLATFWKRHDRKRLRANSLIEIIRAGYKD